MGKKGHFDGSKRRGGHTTIISAVEEFVRAAERLPEVKGISPGFIDPKAKSKKPRITVKQIPAGLNVKAFGNNSKQELIVFTSSPKVVEEKLKRFFNQTADS